jgi:hypothetical protein
MGREPENSGWVSFIANDGTNRKMGEVLITVEILPKVRPSVAYFRSFRSFNDFSCLAIYGYTTFVYGEEDLLLLVYWYTLLFTYYLLFEYSNTYYRYIQISASYISGCVIERKLTFQF